MAGPARHQPTSLAAPLAWAYAALVLYASLFPFSGWRWPPGQGLISLLVLPWPPWKASFDLWANLLGYLPFGLLTAIALLGRGVGLPRAMGVVVAIAAGLSYATEVVQTFLPNRHPSLKDTAMNVAGTAIGAALGWLLHSSGLVARWQHLRQLRFVPRSGGTLALLALWPVGLMFPTPVALGLGQIGSRLHELVVDVLEDVPWAAPLHDALAAQPLASAPLGPLSEGVVTALGLLAPCMLAFAVARPGLHRVPLALGACAMAIGGMTLSTLLNFGPEHALAWLAPATLPAIFGAALAALALLGVSRRIAAGLGLLALAAGVALVAQAPEDPYFAQSLQNWEHGRFVHFHGIAQWIGLLWPYAAMIMLLAQLGRREAD